MSRSSSGLVQTSGPMNLKIAEALILDAKHPEGDLIRIVLDNVRVYGFEET